MKKPKILVTGSTGFVGQQVMKALSLLVVDLSIIVRPEKVSFFQQDTSVKSIIISTDIFAESSSWWKTHCLDVDIFIHLAWYAEPGKYLDSPLNTDCYNGTVSMIKGASKAGIKKFVGGAGIVAAHAAGLGAKVKLISVGGNDDALKFSQQSLESFSVEAKNNVRKNLLNLMFYIFMNDASNFH